MQASPFFEQLQQVQIPLQEHLIRIELLAASAIVNQTGTQSPFSFLQAQSLGDGIVTCEYEHDAQRPLVYAVLFTCCMRAS